MASISHAAPQHADEIRAHVVEQTEDYSLSTIFAAKHADKQPIFFELKLSHPNAK